MDTTAFELRNRNHWDQALDQVGISQNETRSWTCSDDISTRIDLFVGSNLCHVFYPTGGGLDWKCLTHTAEAGCVAISTQERAADIFSPMRLEIAHVAADPLESFLLIELAPLAADPVETNPPKDRQELLDVGGQYYERWHWDAGYLGHGPNGEEIPIPDDARLISRWLQGKLLLTSKASTWNRVPSTYDGRHNRMDVGQIRNAIEKALAVKSA